MYYSSDLSLQSELIEVAESIEVAVSNEIAESIEVAVSNEIAESIEVAVSNEIAESIEVAVSNEIAESIEVAVSNEIAESSEEFFPIFVDKSLLPSASESSASSFSYLDVLDEFGPSFLQNIINKCLIHHGTRSNGTSKDTFDDPDDFEDLMQYELYSEKMEQRTDDIDMPVDDNRPYDVQIKDVRKGVIINSTVYLNNHQWNTFVNLSEKEYYCAVCAAYFYNDEHISTDSHLETLSMYKPLFKYEASIVRKILDSLHCAVCNALFHETESGVHFSSDNHNAKILFACNKAADMYDSDFNEAKSDTYHFNSKAINNDVEDINTSNNDIKYYGNAYQELEYVDDETDDDFDVIEPPLNLEHSYASMARRPKTDLPEVLHVEFGNKKVTVNYNSWNMIINPQRNRYYCMVCTELGHIREQADHCQKLSHVERLARCINIHSYGMHLVRQVDDKLYHCGHCNNLQLIHEMANHIATQHRNKQSNINTPFPSTHLNDPKKPTASNDKENSINNANLRKLNFENNTFSKERAVANVPSTYRDKKIQMYKDLLAANSNIDDIVICAYGRAIRITKMAYNIVCVRGDQFYCALCETDVAKSFIMEHISNMTHLNMLQNTPFIEAFNVHLFRPIRQALHCALCNLLLSVDNNMIENHQFTEMHIQRHREAIRPITNEDIPQSKEPKSVDGDNKTFTNDVYNGAAKIEATCVDNMAAELQAKNGVQVTDGEDSDESDIDDFDFDEHVYVKLGNTFSKITNSAYNTLVGVGDGSRYCFVCTVVVEKELKKHVDSRGHVDNIENCKFVDKYKEDLLRQIFLTYHCSICNVLLTRKQLNDHLSWSIHAEQADSTRMSGKQRKLDLKSGMKQYNVSTVKENIYLNGAEPKIKVHLNIAMQKKKLAVIKKNKVVIFNDNALKIGFDAWHSVSKTPKGYKCKMCQCEFSGMDLGNHVASDWHKASLEKFEMEYSPALMRKINNTTVNCVICNTELTNNLIPEHVQGRKHRRTFDAMLEEGFVTENYTDCDENALTL